MPERFPDVAFHFMTTFARFEEALKRVGYLKNTRAAQADWDAFARDLAPEFFDEVRQAPEAATLVTRPPKARLVSQQGFEWGEPQSITDAVSLFNALRRARNNLYHGNKFIGDPDGDQRGEQLLVESLWVLNLALAKNEKLKKATEANA